MVRTGFNNLLQDKCFPSVHPSVIQGFSERGSFGQAIWKLETKKNLRHSHYATSKVFGPLSAQFEPFVLPSSLTHRSYKLYPKLGSGGSFNQKDRGFTSGLSPNFSLGSGQYKRASNAQWDSSKNKKSRQSDNLVKSISPQEALRRSRENSGRQNQFFRGNQGRGKRIFQNSKRK